MPTLDREQIPVNELAAPVHETPKAFQGWGMSAEALTTMVGTRLRGLGHQAFTTDNIWVDEMIAEGKLLDGEGRPLSTEYTLSNEGRSQLVGQKLLNGESLYVYGTDELYPREVRMNPQTGEVEFGDMLSKEPEPPKDPAKDADFQRRKQAYDRVHQPEQENKVITGSSQLQKKLTEIENREAEAEREALRESVEKQLKEQEQSPYKEVPELYDGPEYAPPKPREVDGKDRNALTEGMNKLIRDDLGYPVEGTNLGKSRMLDYLAETGRLLDGKGNPIVGDVSRSDEARSKEFGSRLQNGESFFVYGKGELYPRELRYDKESGTLQCGKPLARRPEKPGPEASKDEMQEYQRQTRAYDKFSGETQLATLVKNDPVLREKNQKRQEIIAENDKIRQQQLEERVKNYNPKDPIPETERYDGDPKDNEAMLDRLAVAVGKNMGYEEEFSKVTSGTVPLGEIARNQGIFNQVGGRIDVPDGADEKVRAEMFGKKLMDGESLYICRKGEVAPREVSYDKETHSINIGEPMTQEPMAPFKRPTRWDRFMSALGNKKAQEIVHNQKKYEDAYQAYRTFSDPKFKEEREKNDPYFRKQRADAKREEMRKRQEERQKQEEAELEQKEQHKKDYGEDFEEKVTQRLDKMVEEYNKARPDSPLTQKGFQNLETLCRNYEMAKMDLEAGRLKGPNGGKTVQDIMAFDLASKGINGAGNSRLLWDVNNPNYATNMTELVKNSSDYEYMTGRTREKPEEFLKSQLSDPQMRELHSRSVYEESRPVAAKVDEEYYAAKAMKKNMEIQAQQKLKSPQELAKNFKPENVSPQEQVLQ